MVNNDGVSHLSVNNRHFLTFFRAFFFDGVFDNLEGMTFIPDRKAIPFICNSYLLSFSGPIHTFKVNQ
jgi:hypothetical protein